MKYLNYIETITHYKLLQNKTLLVYLSNRIQNFFILKQKTKNWHKIMLKKIAKSIF